MLDTSPIIAIRHGVRPDEVIAVGVNGFGRSGLVYSPGDTADMVGAKARAALTLCGK